MDLGFCLRKTTPWYEIKLKKHDTHLKRGLDFKKNVLHSFSHDCIPSRPNQKKNISEETNTSQTAKKL